ncbi:MAG: hypothetical protein M1124_01805 [Candidatus Marsarchaeota archaeon]|nr:hypothetical protein [Candidatus Marsarchaeota archaeon]
MQDENGKLIPISVKMNVNTVEGFSGHSDRKELMSFVKNLKPKPTEVFTMHGEEQKCEDLASSIAKLLGTSSRAPRNLDSIRLK